MPKKTKKRDRNSVFTSANAKLHPVEVNLVMDMIEGFMRQIRRDDIYVEDRSGEALIDILEDTVERQLKKGQEPKKARANLNGFLELYFQVVALCYSDEDLDLANAQIETFRRRILAPLHRDTPIQRGALDETDAMITSMRHYFSQAPRNDIALVNENICAVCDATGGNCNANDMRKWLIKEIEKREAMQTIACVKNNHVSMNGLVT